MYTLKKLIQREIICVYYYIYLHIIFNIFLESPLPFFFHVRKLYLKVGLKIIHTSESSLLITHNKDTRAKTQMRLFVLKYTTNFDSRNHINTLHNAYNQLSLQIIEITNNMYSFNRNVTELLIIKDHRGIEDLRLYKILFGILQASLIHYVLSCI